MDLLTWIEAHGALLALVVPLALVACSTSARGLAAASLAAGLPGAAAFFARASDFFAALGPHAVAVLEAVRGRGRVAASLRPPPPPPPSSPHNGAGPPGLVVLGVALCVSALGCVRPLDVAIQAANTAGELGELEAAALRVDCVERYRAAETREAVERLDAECLPRRDAYRGLRAAHAGLVATVLAVQAGADPSRLGPAIVRAAAAGELVAKAASK